MAAFDHYTLKKELKFEYIETNGSSLGVPLLLL
ncbi:MAG: hypothetical protein RLZZ546_2557, partial [Bacteroidota bacterium]